MYCPLVLVKEAAWVPLLATVDCTVAWPVKAGTVHWLKLPLSKPSLKYVPRATPLPLKVTLCGLPAALSVIVTLALRVLPAVGVKVTMMVQVELGGTVVGE